MILTMPAAYASPAIKSKNNYSEMNRLSNEPYLLWRVEQAHHLFFNRRDHMKKTTLLQLVKLANKLLPQYESARIQAIGAPAGADTAELQMNFAKEILMIGNELTRALVANCNTLNELLDKWTHHHYRPTLRGSPGSPEAALADIYDMTARLRQIDIQAYRGDWK